MTSPGPLDKPLDLLLIEDNPGDARLVEEHLEAGGLDAEIRWKQSLEAGLKAARETRPELLVLDLGLPDSEGLDAVRTISGEFPDVPVVVLTGRDDPELGQSAVREGAQDFLVKGDVMPGALTHTLRYALLRTRADAEIRRREKRFGALLSNISDVISVIAPDGTVLYESPSVKRVLGYECEELEGENILEYFHPEDRERIQGEIEALATVPEEGKVGEARFRHADGSWRVLEARGRMPPPESDIGGIIVVSRDVTERVVRERKLERATASLRERVKEQSCLYDVSRLLHADEREFELRLQDVLERLPGGWQHPEVAAGRIRLGGASWTSSRFSDDSPSLTCSISANGARAGTIEVCYLEERPDEDIGPFIMEEQELLEALADQIGIAVDRRATHRELETERSRLEDVFRQAPSWIAVFEGPEHVFARINPAYQMLVGDRDSLGRPVREVFPELEDEGYFDLLDEVYETGERITAQERLLPLETDEGIQEKYITFVYQPRREDGEITGVIAHGVDVTEQVTERRQAEGARKALQESEERFRQMAENINEVFWLWDPDAAEQLYLSPAYEDIWGRPVEEAYESDGTWLGSIHPEDRARVREVVFEEQAVSYELEYRIIRPDGEVRWIHTRGFPVTDEEGEIYRVAGVARDVTKQKRLEEQLRHRALHDPLTGLANRTLLVDRVEQGLARARRSGQPLGLLMVDVVRFKHINDRLGHAAGDRVLVALARRLQGEVREADTVARWGGDEFVIVLPELDAPEAIRTVHERIQRALVRPIEVMGESLHLDLFMGGVLYGADDHPQMVQTSDPAELVRFGDLALHRAKERPTTNFHLFDPAEEVEGVAHIRREQELHRGLEAEEFVPHYQPIVRLEDGALVGFEALARWNHPERGIVSPGEFIPLAEELGLIDDLGEAILRRGCREAAEWARGNGAAPSTVSFNLSGQQFEDPEVAHRLRGAVEEAGLSPENVILEVTESTIMQEPATVDQLRALGFRVYVDDFGTGYSSFAYLRDLSLDGLKIDLSFVQRMTGSRTDAALVETMLTLGETLDLRVVAEGVETEKQRELLCEMGCDLGQGYLFGRPMSAEDARALLE